MSSPSFKGPNLLFYSVVIASLALFVFAVTPSGIRRANPGDVREICFADNISPAHQKLIERFNDLHRGRLKVVPINLPFTKFSTNERKELLTRALRSSTNRLDVFAVDLFWIPRFAKWSEPLASHFSQQEQQDLLSYALESCFDHGTLVAIPLYLDIGMMYYRRDLLQHLPDREEIEKTLKASITWEDFIALQKRLPHTDDHFYIFAADNYEGLMCSFIELLVSQGLPLFDGKTVNLQTPEAQRALKLLVDLVNTYGLASPRITDFKEIDCYRYALEKDVIFIRGWPGNLRTYVADYGDKISNMQIAALPHFRSGKPVAVFGGWNLMISKSSSRKTEAMEFLKFLVSRESQRTMFEEMGYLPANNSVYEDSAYVRAHPELRYYRQLFSTGFHRPASAEYTQMSDIISYYVHLAIKNKISIPAALEQATAQVAAQNVLVH